MSENVNETKELKVEDIKRAADEKRCPVQKALSYFEGFLDGPMCGKCFPCEMGSYEARLRLSEIIAGRGRQADIDALQRIAANMLESSRCKKGKDTAAFLVEWVRSEQFRDHLEGKCAGMECLPFIEYRIIADTCTNCGVCKSACKHEAIFGEKRKPSLGCYSPFVIRQKKCVKCDECRAVCPEEAIVVVNAKQGETVGA